MNRTLRFFIFMCLSCQVTLAQNAQLSGVVKDKTGAVVPQAQVTLSNLGTAAVLRSKTSKVGFFVFASVEPGRYDLEAEAPGFDETVIRGIKIDTAANESQDITLQIRQSAETVTVTEQSELNATNGTVSTVISHGFIENMPLNGKDMTTLFELSPGTILNAGGPTDSGGGFSVDGQRPTANYLTIDGASGNAYVPIEGGSNVTGAGIATSASGGTNGILPIDAIEEYRMDTSTYTAENGRTPGGQIQVRTRSGTNAFHGTLFENFRNQVLDATDWFVKYDGLKQSPLRMNDFGGTLGGPILKNKLFFFVAHDTLVLDQPSTVTQQDVPTTSLSQSAYSAFVPFLSAFPTGNGGADAANPGFDFFNASYPYLIRDHTTSVRIDAQLPRSIHSFFRVNIAPSSSYQPGIEGQGSDVNIATYTGGIAIPITRSVLNDFTVNETGTNTRYNYFVSALDGNNPNALEQNLPSGVNPSTDYFQWSICSANFTCPGVNYGPQGLNRIQQWNLLDSVSFQPNKQVIKVGGDFLRRQTYINGGANNYALYAFLDSTPPITADLAAGNLIEIDYYHQNEEPVITVQNLSLYVNDDVHPRRNLVINAGIRWEYNPAAAASPLGVLALQGAFSNPATVQASVSTHPVYANRYNNFAPRFGFAWTPSERQGHSTVIRGGLGIYFDTGQAASMTQADILNYPYQSQEHIYSITPYQSVNWSSLASTAVALPLPVSAVYLVDPKLISPRTYEWSLTLEQQLGPWTKLSSSYVGNDGEKLAGNYQYYQTKNGYGQYTVNANLVQPGGNLYYLTNRSHSNYQALQEQMMIRFGGRLDALTSYTWAHAEDNGSADFSAVGATAINPMSDSAYDLRQIFAAALHYAPVGIEGNRLVRAITRGWGLDTIARLQTASPFTVYTSDKDPTAFLDNADAVPGQPAVLHQRYLSSGKLVPGGVLLNHAAFAAPPTDSLGNPLRQGDSPTNGYRLFGLNQWDVAASRSWTLWESVNLNFRVDVYNLVNTPMFANPNLGWSSSNTSTFGLATNTYAGGNGAVAGDYDRSGEQLAVFQNGGARSIQLSMKLKF